MSAGRTSAVAAALAALSLAGCGKDAGGPPTTYTGVDGHAAYFPLVGTPHDPTAAGSAVTCAACHAVEAPPSSGTYVFRSFAEFDCTRCHGQASMSYGASGNGQAGLTAFHAGVSGFQWLSGACYGCHKDGSSAPANHPGLFPIGTGSAHAGVTCAQCHLDAASRQDVTKLGCATAGCHDAVPGFSGGHAAVSGVSILALHTSQGASTDLPLTAQNCLKCHADSQVDAVASHTTSSGGFSRSQHKAGGCLTCHSATRSDKPFGADFSTTPGCAICHPNGIPD